MSCRATTLPRTLLLATVVLTVCCADGGALWRHGLLPAIAGEVGRGDLRSSEVRHRAAVARHERPARPAIRPTALHAERPAATVAPTPSPVLASMPWSGRSAALSFAELRLPPPAA